MIAERPGTSVPRGAPRGCVLTTLVSSMHLAHGPLRPFLRTFVHLSPFRPFYHTSVWPSIGHYQTHFPNVTPFLWCYLLDPSKILVPSNSYPVPKSPIPPCIARLRYYLKKKYFLNTLKNASGCKNQKIFEFLKKIEFSIWLYHRGIGPYRRGFAILGTRTLEGVNRLDGGHGPNLAVDGNFAFRVRPYQKPRGTCHARI